MSSDDNKRIITWIVIIVVLYAFFTGIGEGEDEFGGEGETIIV
ncbi:hypothetical protein [Paenibacillus koleovorans]|nr:hypothetical protein [Paenibacillus koleovorans]